MIKLKEIVLGFIIIFCSLFFPLLTKAELSNSPDDNGDWWYYTNGIIDTSITTVAENNNGWWYVKNGKVDFDYCGFASNENGDWYVKNGKVDFSIKDIIYGEIRGDYGWWNIVNNKIVYNINTIGHNENGWWYIGKDGKVDFNFTGIYFNENGTWYCEDGKVNFNYNYVGDTYTIEDSRVYFNKNIVIFGDSISFGMTINSKFRFTSILANELRLKEFNYGVCGAGFTQYGYLRDCYIPTQLNDIRMTDEEKLNTSIVIIEGGFNDYKMSGHSDIYYTITSIEYMIEQASSIFPNATIYLMYGDDGPNNIECKNDYRMAIKLVNLYFSTYYPEITVIHNFNNKLNCDPIYYNDGVHPNEYGHSTLAQILITENFN